MFLEHSGLVLTVSNPKILFEISKLKAMEICLYFYDHKYYKCLSILSVSTHIGRLSNRVKRLNVQNTLKKWFHGETLSLFVLPFSRVIFYVLLSNVFQYLQKKALLIQLFVYKLFLYCI